MAFTFCIASMLNPDHVNPFAQDIGSAGGSRGVRRACGRSDSHLSMNGSSLARGGSHMSWHRSALGFATSAEDRLDMTDTGAGGSIIAGLQDYGPAQGTHSDAAHIDQDPGGHSINDSARSASLAGTRSGVANLLPSRPGEALPAPSFSRRRERTPPPAEGGSPKTGPRRPLAPPNWRWYVLVAPTGFEPALPP